MYTHAVHTQYNLAEEELGAQTFINSKKKSNTPARQELMMPAIHRDPERSG